MSTETEHKIDRAGWPSGPWDQEPDKLSWKTATGLPALIVRNSMGALCGYVAVTAGHPCYGKDYTNEYEMGEDGEKDYARPLPSPISDLRVHGGITYGEKCARAICHVPEPGEPDDVWWIGFDCAHHGDDSPGLMAHMRNRGLYGGGDYREVGYVRAECERLAAQLKEMA